MKKYFKFVIIAFLMLLIVNVCDFKVYGLTNEDYSKVDVLNSEQLKEQEDNSALNDILSGLASVIFEHLLKFIYSCARVVENVLTNFSKWLFGVEQFPWEDLIVFNSLPYLDINFFNPSQGSIFVNADGKALLGDSIKSVYFSLLILATSVLGIGVAITAIRLAISTIAAEKAKYKEAITKCLYTVVMLFSVHILISFIFYLNETICITASNILKNVVTKEELASLAEVSQDDFGLFTTANAIGPDEAKQFIEAREEKLGGLGWLLTTSWNDRGSSGKGGQIDKNKAVLQKKYNEFSNTYGDSFINIAAYLSSSGSYCESRFTNNGDNKNRTGYYFDPNPKDTKKYKNKEYKYDESKESVKDFLKRIKEALKKGKIDDKCEHNGSLYYITASGGNIDAKKHWNTEDNATDCQAAYGILLMDAENILKTKNEKALAAKYDGDTSKDYYTMIKKAYKVYKEGNLGGFNIISNLGDFFKNKGAELTNSHGWNAELATSIILYAILLVQSIVLLINYIKRLFYVTILAMLAPIVVIYDFFISAI